MARPPIQTPGMPTQSNDVTSQDGNAQTNGEQTTLQKADEALQHINQDQEQADQNPQPSEADLLRSQLTAANARIRDLESPSTEAKTGEVRPKLKKDVLTKAGWIRQEVG